MKKIVVIAILAAIVVFVGCENPIMIRYLDRLEADRHTRPTITTVSLQSGVVGMQYNQTLTATGSRAITWGMTSGGLPPGLSIVPETGVISGTPTAEGTFNFTVRAANNTGNDTKELSIVVNSLTTYGDFLISLGQNNEITIIGFTGVGGDVEIPSSIHGFPVTSIGNNAFQNSNLTSVTIPDSITSIEAGAFKDNELTSVTIDGNGVTLGVNAFPPNESNFNTVYNGIAGTFIRPNASYTTWARTTHENYFQIEVLNDQVTIIGFTGSGGTIVIPPTIVGLPVTTIGETAFVGNQLTSVTIPDSVTSIGDGAFIDNQLTSIIIPNSVTYIGFGAFLLNQLINVTIGNSVTTIGDGAFANNQLASVTIPNSVTSIGEATFYSNQLTSVDIPNSVTTIGGGAFGNNQLASVIIPDSVTYIGEAAFRSNQLTSVVIPDSVTYIGWWAFFNNQLTSVTIPDSVTTIGISAFAGNQLTSITIGADVTVSGTFDWGPSWYVFDNGFEEVYNNGGRLAGTWTRPDTTSRTWTRQ